MKKSLKTATILSMAALLFISGASCHSDKKIASAELSKNYTRTATETGSVTEDFKSELMDFSLSLFRKTLTKDDKNDLISPISAALCLALINNGASGDTRAQIENLFGMDTDTLNRSLYAYTSSLYSSNDCRVSLANSIWMRENALNVKPQFLQANADWYNAQAYAAPFDSTTVEDINNWCYNNTKGKIEKIINEISPYTVMYLINTVDFDAKWAKKYESEDIENGIFHNFDGNDSDVKMLHSEESRYLMDEDAIGFTKPYKDGKYSFVALLPEEGVDVYGYIDSLNTEKWQSLWESADPTREDYEYREVHVRMPEFTYEAEISLNEALQTLGVTDMFSRGKADFSGIDETQRLYCDFVKQKTYIQLDHNGTKAAAITWGGMKDTSIAPTEPLYITLDRPFVYAIVDNGNELPLFLGAVTNL